jgi:hypothetical protein
MRKTSSWIACVLFISVSASCLTATSATASSITILGGRPEVIDLPCDVCRGGLGIPVGTMGYSALNNPVTSPALVMSLLLDEASFIRFTSIGLDSWSYNQFFVDQDNDGDPFNDAPVFSFPRPGDDPLAVRNPVVLWLPAGIIHYGYRTAVDLGDFRTPGFNVDTFGPFVSCQPTLTDPNPRTCTQGILGFADGVVMTANDDHQDLGVQFAVAPVPEPATLTLTAMGLLGIAAVARRRRRATR